MCGHSAIPLTRIHGSYFLQLQRYNFLLRERSRAHELVADQHQARTGGTNRLNIFFGYCSLLVDRFKLYIQLENGILEIKWVQNIKICFCQWALEYILCELVKTKEFQTLIKSERDVPVHFTVTTHRAQDRMPRRSSHKPLSVISSQWNAQILCSVKILKCTQRNFSAPLLEN